MGFIERFHLDLARMVLLVTTFLQIGPALMSTRTTVASKEKPLSEGRIACKELKLQEIVYNSMMLIKQAYCTDGLILEKFRSSHSVLPTASLQCD